MLIKNTEKPKAGIVGHKLPVFTEKKMIFKKKPDSALETKKQLQEALKIIDELEETLEVEREERFQAGFASGREEGYKEGLSQINQQIQKMAEAVEFIKNHQQAYIQSAQGFIVDFTLKMVEEMVGSGFLDRQKISVEKITEFVNSTLENFSDSAKYVFRVHKDSVPVFEEHLMEIQDRFNEKTVVNVVEDPSLAPGDCMVETDFGALDGRIKTHFREIVSAIAEVQE